MLYLDGKWLGKSTTTRAQTGEKKREKMKQDSNAEIYTHWSGEKQKKKKNVPNLHRPFGCEQQSECIKFKRLSILSEQIATY